MSARDAANTARLAAAAKAKAAADAQAAENIYYTKIVGDTGKTQAQLDAATNAAETATQITKSYGNIGITSTVDPNTGEVITTNKPITPATTTDTTATTTVTTDPSGKPKWVKAGTVNTAKGPVDVDASGKAEDGTTPVAFEDKGTGDFLTRNGLTAGPFPKELEQFFGSSAGVIGYKIVTNDDGSQQLEVSTSPGSTSTFGFKFTRDKSGKYVKFNSQGGGTATDGAGGTGGATLKTAAQLAAEAKAAEGKAERQSAYDLLYSQFKLYGLEALVEPLKGLITTGASPAEFTIKLRESDAYKKRFSANAQRIAKGLRSLSEAEYIQLEDQYQDVMRRYGLPDTYYTRGEMGIQEGFTKFLEGDVSPVELEDRISTAQKRVLNANPEVTQALKQFYPDITNADILAYTLDPKNAIENIKRKVTAAEIGGAAIQSGLQTGMTRAEELGAAGITKAQAQQGFGTIAGGLERGSQLASIYGENPYTQTTAEQEVFGLAGKTEAEKQRKKLTGLEKATFSGQTGLTSGALVRDRAGAY
jgi:hypothetical protein